MRILHVCDSYLPRLGGIELHVRDLTIRQRAAGHHVTVATVTDGRWTPDDPVVRLDSLGAFPQPRALSELTRLIASRRYDTVHAHSSLVSPLAWRAAHAAGAADIASVLTMHSMLPTGLTARALRALAPRPSSKVVWTAVSTVAAASLRGIFPEQEVSVLPNGIDAQDWAVDDSNVYDWPGVADRALTLVSVMRTARRKRPLQLLDILGAIRQGVPAGQSLRAVLVGSGPLDGAIRRRLTAAGLGSWVTHTGGLSRYAIRELLQRSDLYLAPAHLESFGIAALEARSAGLPVIAMARGGVSDFIGHDVEGLLVESDTAMAVETARLLTDAPRLRRMQEHNRFVSPVISWPRVLELHWRAYAAAAARVRPQAQPATEGTRTRKSAERTQTRMPSAG